MLIEGRVRTLDPDAPEASAVLIADGRIAAVATSGSLQCPGEVWRLPRDAVVQPGFVDAHLHLLASAAARLSIDCSDARSIGELLRTIRTAPRSRNGWLRAHGYDDAFFAERRHPTVEELDAAAPDVPLVLHHATGHAVVRNSLAIVEGRAPRIERADLMASLRDFCDEMTRSGVTSVCDATVTNGVEEIELLRSAGLPQRVVVMPGLSRLGEVIDAGMRFGAAGVGHAKLYVDDDDDPRDVAALVEHAHRRGFPVALHVLDIGPLDAALHALESSSPPDGTRDRLEHVALAMPEQVERIAACGVDVVTQPSFPRIRGAKYREELSDVELEWLYPIASLVHAGVRVAASSDSPVTRSGPIEWIADTEAMGVPAPTALTMACGPAIAPGAPADLVVLRGGRVLATIRGGEIIYRA